jgi:hypothetical protein
MHSFSVFIVPSIQMQGRFNVHCDGHSLGTDLTLVQTLNLQSSLPLIFKSMGYTLTKEDHYPSGGRLWVFEGGSNEAGVSEKRSHGVSESNQLPTKSSLPKFGVH